jgi:RNA polymerase sigma factor (sigma-70 family)
VVTQPFERLVEQHGATVWRVCRAMAGEDAEDAWAETFVSALRAYPGLTDQVNAEAWLVAIAQRRCIDMWRTRGRRPVPTDRLPERAASAEQSVADVVDLDRALQRLSPRQRACVSYHYLAGLPYADVAQLIGGTPDAARRAAADGVRKLRQLLNPNDEELEAGA